MMREIATSRIFYSVAAPVRVKDTVTARVDMQPRSGETP
jgi:hypothetical protein